MNLLYKVKLVKIPLRIDKLRSLSFWMTTKSLTNYLIYWVQQSTYSKYEDNAIYLLNKTYLKSKWLQNHQIKELRNSKELSSKITKISFDSKIIK